MDVGRRVYYDKATGNVIQFTGTMTGDVRVPTVELDFHSYKSLAERVPETVGVILLEYGDYEEDFTRGDPVRIDLETEGILFHYPAEPGEEPGPPTLPIEAKLIQFRNALTARLEAAEAETTGLQLAVAESYEGLLVGQEETTATQLAITEIYEQLVALQGGVE